MISNAREPQHWARVTRFMMGLVALFSLFGVVVLLALAFGPARVLGWEPIVITSDSMAPRIHRGDVVVIEPFDHRRLGPGTVVTFQDPSRSGYVTHRIVAVKSDGTYTTSGDANVARDSTPVTPDRIQGVGRLLVPRIGMVTLWWRSRSWTPLTVSALCLLGSAWAIRFALHDRFDPWREGRDAVRVRPSRALSTPVMLLAFATATALSAWAPTTSDAAFTSSVDNAASYFSTP